MRRNQKGWQNTWRQIDDKLEKKKKIPQRGGATRQAKTKNTWEKQRDNKRWDVKTRKTSQDKWEKADVMWKQEVKMSWERTRQRWEKKMRVEKRNEKYLSKKKRWNEKYETEKVKKGLKRKCLTKQVDKRRN